MVKKINLRKNKRGWIRLVEVFVSIMLLVGVMLVVSVKYSSVDRELQDQMSTKEIAILRDIELNNSMRTSIINIAEQNLPLEWENFATQTPQVYARIVDLTPANWECRAKVCVISDNCLINWNSGGDVYAKAVVLAADLNTYAPRQLKLFCTIKS